MLNIIRCSVLLIIAVSVAPTYAHHSFAATFSDQIITVEGTVERLKYSNPHVIVYFNVNDENGEETQWLAEGGSATTLRRNGWNKDTLIKGDYIRITGESTLARLLARPVQPELKKPGFSTCHCS
jgi:hypothetical protein